MRWWSIPVALQFAVVSVAAQTSPPVDTIAEARRLRDASDYAGAAALMRPYVASHPDDAGSARFAALMAYWAKDHAAADSIYARALAAHGDDAELRLEYGKFLIETGASTRARGVVAPVVADTTTFTTVQMARAWTLLATAEYWSGDFVTARRELTRALQLDSSLTDARRQLTEIETAAASWVRLGTDVWDDDQPLRYSAVSAEAGWFANALTPSGIAARSSLFDRDGVSESVLSGEATIASYFPAAHIDLAVAGGALRRSFDRRGDWTGRATLGIRLPGTVRVDGRVERGPYTSTVRSLGQAIMVRSLDAGARWGTARGWLGELRVRRATYPDDNSVSTAYGWLLAPLTSRDRATLHAGYGFTASSTEESRFVPRGDIAIIPVPPGQGPVGVPGEYNPYYTPRNLRVHSALAALRLRTARRWTVDLNGRYAIYAHDEAPVLLAVATPPDVTVERGFYNRSFTPWNARGSIECAATQSLRIGVGVEHGREAYYDFTTARVQLTYTFVSAALRRAGVR